MIISNCGLSCLYLSHAGITGEYYIWLRLCVCTRGCTCVCTCMWRSEVNTGIHLTAGGTHSMDLLSCAHLPCAGIMGMQYHAQLFTWVLGSNILTFYQLSPPQPQLLCFRDTLTWESISTALDNNNLFRWYDLNFLNISTNIIWYPISLGTKVDVRK